jgi:hypothetical protein
MGGCVWWWYSKAELNTVQFYLKQGIDMKSRDALKLALGKVSGRWRWRWRWAGVGRLGECV